MAPPSLSPQVSVCLRILLPDFAQVHTPFCKPAMSNASSTAASSGDLFGDAERSFGRTTVSATSWSVASTAGSDTEAVAARRALLFAEANENNTEWVSAAQRGVNRTNAGQAKPLMMDWIFLRRQEDLLRFYRTNPGEAPLIFWGVHNICSPRVKTPG